MPTAVVSSCSVCIAAAAASDCDTVIVNTVVTAAADVCDTIAEGDYRTGTTTTTTCRSGGGLGVVGDRIASNNIDNHLDLHSWNCENKCYTVHTFTFTGHLKKLL